MVVPGSGISSLGPSSLSCPNDDSPQAVFGEASPVRHKMAQTMQMLVCRLFARIIEMVEEEDCLVFVLIDEIESLTSARKAAVSGSEPADAIRAGTAVCSSSNACCFHQIMTGPAIAI